MPSPKLAAGLVAGLILAALSALHVAWAFGVRLGAEAAVPEHNGAPLFRPGPAACLIVATGLAAMAFLVLVRVQIVAVPLAPSIVRAGVLASAAVFAVRACGDFRYVGFFKTVTGTRFATLDSRFYSPLCATLAAMLLFTGW